MSGTQLPIRTHRIKKYGWRRGHLDPRDLRFADIAPPEPATWPFKISLRDKFPPCYDQGQLGSCTGNGIAGALQFERMKQSLQPDYIPSRLFIYYCERLIEGTVDVDAGAEIRDGIKSVANLGAPPEDDWPYDISKFADAPPQLAYTDALKDRALKYYRVDQVRQHIKLCLMDGYPVVFGFAVYDQFESDEAANTGMIQMPDKTQAPIGGHCMCIIGFDDRKTAHGHTGYWECRNSWSPAWGDDGHAWLPYSYLTDPELASDFWTIRLVEA